MQKEETFDEYLKRITKEPHDKKKYKEKEEMWLNSFRF